MAFSAPHVLFVFGGETNHGPDKDQWQFGLRVPLSNDDIATNDAQMTQLVNDASADATIFWTAIAGVYDASTKFAYVKANVIGQDGLYVNQNKTYRVDFPALKPGTNAAGPMPADLAVVASLTTGAQRGLAARGRIFLPNPGATTLDITGKIKAASVTTIRNAVADLCTNIGNKPGLDVTFGYGDVSIMSKVGAGAARTVTGCRVGNLYDVQRRRSNKMVEAYNAVTVPRPPA